MKSIQRPALLPLLFFCFVLSCFGGEGKTCKYLPVPSKDTTVAKASFPFTDMVLCYGGSRHRVHYLWDKERFSHYVTYIDETGKEHWLFDAFLCLELQSTDRPDGKSYSFCTGYLQGIAESAGKDQWQELLDYWFTRDSGFDALDQAAGDAESRIGQPPYKRKVVVSMPDPILHLYYDKLDTPTKYWGQLNGKALDFADPADRIAAYEWFIDQVMARFKKAKYKNIELAGFYKVSEEITTPDEGWCYDMKKLDLVIPSVSDYIHSKGQKIYWIPYRGSAGYRRAAQFKLDYVWMQPNYFWKGEEYPLDETFQMIIRAKDGMEFEMDGALLEGSKDCDLYKLRFRKYMEYSKLYKLYGNTPFSYYVGEDAFNDLSKSTNPADKALYNEFCHFIIEDPLRTETSSFPGEKARKVIRTGSGKWKLVWHDEFSRDGLPDSAKWDYDYDAGNRGWGNNEDQWYTSGDADNAFVKDGVLNIVARKESVKGRSYTSARLVTRGKEAWTCGRFEIRAKLPHGRGMWPAIWLLAATKEYGGWPRCGEIDIMENVGYDPEIIVGSFHTNAYNHKIGTQKSARISCPTCESDYHIYSLEWEKNICRLYLDDTFYSTFENDGTGNPDTWPFDKPFYMILNVAVGGNWGRAKGIDDSVFPQSMSVDYVRVYKKIRP